MATRKGMGVTTTVSFQVTFELPKSMSIADARENVKDAVMDKLAGRADVTKLKVHLTNKEISYGKR